MNYQEFYFRNKEVSLIIYLYIIFKWRHYSSSIPRVYLYLPFWWWFNILSGTSFIWIEHIMSHSALNVSRLFIRVYMYMPNYSTGVQFTYFFNTLTTWNWFKCSWLFVTSLSLMMQCNTWVDYQPVSAKHT